MSSLLNPALAVVLAADEQLEALRAAIQSAPTRARLDDLDAFVRSMRFFRLCEMGMECPHALRHECCRLIERRRAALNSRTGRPMQQNILQRSAARRAQRASKAELERGAA